MGFDCDSVVEAEQKTSILEKKNKMEGPGVGCVISISVEIAKN